MKNLGESGAMQEILARLRTVKPEDKALWGSMSAIQMVHHLNLACEVALGERIVTPLKGLPPTLVKFFALRLPTRWPKNLATTPELKRAIANTPPDGSMGKAIEDTAARFQLLVAASRYSPAHAMFGPMKRSDWMRWGYLHADHHLRQFGR